MLAKVGAYGGNALRYALEKEKAKTVKVNNMPKDLDATSIWYLMKHHCQLHQQDRTVGRKLERFIVSFVISPSTEESKDFTMQDWANLQDESLEVIDSLGLTPKGFKAEVKTNFQGSMNVGGLHEDSKSGTLHLHLDCCRVDLEGNTNIVYCIIICSHLVFADISTIIVKFKLNCVFYGNETIADSIYQLLAVRCYTYEDLA